MSTMNLNSFLDCSLRQNLSYIYEDIKSGEISLILIPVILVELALASIFIRPVRWINYKIFNYFYPITYCSKCESSISISRGKHNVVWYEEEGCSECNKTFCNDCAREEISSYFTGEDLKESIEKKERPFCHIHVCKSCAKILGLDTKHNYVVSQLYLSGVITKEEHDSMLYPRESN